MSKTLRTYTDYRKAIDNLNSSGYHFHHSGSRRGYISRRVDGVLETYKGKFGEGYIIARPRYDTTNYCYIDYYIKEV